MVTTHLIAFGFFKGAQSYVAPTGNEFKGYTTVGALAFMRAFSPAGGPEPPVPSAQSMYPLQRRKRGR